MTVFFVEPAAKAQQEFSLKEGFGALVWQRGPIVTSAAFLTALLHGLVLLAYLHRPAEPVVTQAMPLPMIAIALAAPAQQAVALPQAAPTPPKPVVTPPKPVVKPKPKPKPKVTPKPKAPSEIKKPQPEKTEPKADTSPPAPAAPSTPAPASPIASAPKANHASASASPVITQANANADYLHNPAPPYPRMAKQRHWEGQVTLRVLVTPDGRCGDISVHRSSGHDVLDEAALDAVRNWRFVPGKKGDTPISSWVNVPIAFTLE